MLNLTPLLRIYTRRRLAKLSALEPKKTQEGELLKLVRTAQETRFGLDHGFSEIRSVADYQKRVPLRYYEDFWTTYWKPAFPKLENLTWPGLIPFFPVSSGTSSGTTKYIPCTHEMLASNTKAGLDMFTYHLANRPKSQIFGGKNFLLSSSASLVTEAPGVFSGDLSGITTKTLPWWARLRYFPPLKLALIKDWEEKMNAFGPASLTEDIRMLSGIPSWLLLFFDRLFKLRPSVEPKLVNFYPNLEMLIHGGINFAPYHKQFSELLDGSRAELREVYPASEGFIAVADRAYGDGLRVVLDHGIFYEFIPVDELQSKSPTRHWIGTIERDVNYAVVMTTCAGLWSYILGDTVKFVDVSVPRLLVTGRTSYFLSAFGEHLIGEEVEDAVSLAAQEIGAEIADYSVGPLFPESTSELGRHLYIIEFAHKNPSLHELDLFSVRIDERLCERNEDYLAHRKNGFGLNPPLILTAKSGMFAAWMKSRGKLGGQHKVPRLINNAELFKNLREFAEKY